MPTKKEPEPTPIQYRPAIVTFIDILGFREFVRKASALDVFGAVRELQESTSSNDKEWMVKSGFDAEANWTRSFVFSDSIVRARTYGAPYSEGGLFQEVISLVHAQASLIWSGILIRGGLTIGDIYFDSDVLFGPALIAAYDLESAHANYPRIVVDPAAINAFRSDPRLRAEHHNEADEIHYLSAFCGRGVMVFGSLIIFGRFTGKWTILPKTIRHSLSDTGT